MKILLVLKPRQGVAVIGRFVALDGQDESTKLPDTLKEYKVVTSASQKPTAIVALLRELSSQKTLVFTSSLESTHRLTLLLQACPTIGATVAEHSSLIPYKARASVLKQFKAGSIRYSTRAFVYKLKHYVFGIHYPRICFFLY